MLNFKSFITEQTFHPKKDENGRSVVLHNPTLPTNIESWNDKNSIATTIPDHKDLPKNLHGLDFSEHETPKSWKGIEGQGEFGEPEISANKRLSVGIVMVEPDNRVWVSHPSNQFGGYEATFPKGSVEKELNNRENAIKEVHEETGLRAEIDGHLGDYEKTTSTTRYYTGKRIGGHPSDMGWESQAVSLVPINKLHEVVNHPRDRQIVKDIQQKYGEKK